MHHPSILLILALAAISTTPTPPLLQSFCSAQHGRKYVDISSARIEKSSTFEYSLALYDSPFTILKNNSEIILQGNFSKLILRNRALNRQFCFEGRQMILKIPADHVFSMQKIPDLEIQIIHFATEDNKANSFRHVMLSQLYVASTFTSKTETELSRYFGPQARDGDVVETSKIVKLIEGFPMLMYKGSPESFPCRTDLLCLLKREYQLVSQEDLQGVRRLLFEDGKVLPKTSSVKRKSLYEIQQTPKKPQGSEEREEL